MRSALAALALLVLSTPGYPDAAAVPPSDIHSAKKDLEKIRKEIRENQKAVQSSEVRERSEVARLEALNRELEAARRDASVHQRNLELVRDRLARVQSESDRLSGEAAEERQALAAGLRALYRERLSGGALLLFSARTPGALAARARYFSALAQATRVRVDALGSDLGQLDSYHREYQGRESELERHVREVDEDRRRVENERRSKQAQLREVRGRKARAAEAVRELKQSADRLQGMLDGLIQEQIRREAERKAAERAELLERERREQEQRAEDRRASDRADDRRREELARRWVEDAAAASEGSGLKGRLPWPVQGRLISRFGKQMHPIFRTPVFNRGVEIAAPYGASVKAVEAGVVDFAGPMEGFGQLVVLDHGKGMLSVYGYNSQVLVHKGQTVSRGEALAEVGEVGTSGQPSLYFEIRQGVRAQDPLKYLSRGGR